jgi:hypothetical protein
VTLKRYPQDKGGDDMPVRKPFLLDEGYKDGSYYAIHSMGLRHTKLFKLHLNGVETYHRDDDSIKEEFAKRGLSPILKEGKVTFPEPVVKAAPTDTSNDNDDESEGGEKK